MQRLSATTFTCSNLETTSTRSRSQLQRIRLYSAHQSGPEMALLNSPLVEQFRAWSSRFWLPRIFLTGLLSPTSTPRIVSSCLWTLHRQTSRTAFIASFSHHLGLDELENGDSL